MVEAPTPSLTEFVMKLLLVIGLLTIKSFEYTDLNIVSTNLANTNKGKYVRTYKLNLRRNSEKR